MSDTSIRVAATTKERLEVLKREGESYDDVIRRLTTRDKWNGFGIASGDAGTAREGIAEIHDSMRQGMERDLDETE